MTEKVNCITCMAFFLGLHEAYIEGERASLSKCVTKKIHIRQPIRNCNKHYLLPHVEYNLERARKKLAHIGEVLDSIEYAFSLPPKTEGEQ
jgi:hypothetical protein